MLPVQEARRRLLAGLTPLTERERVPLAAALGRVLAAPVTAEVDSPAFANSSMDGFAVRAEDIAAASPDAPTALSVVGDAPAGQMPQAAVGPGTTVRIMTGAPLPQGADTVVPVELTDVRDRSAGASLPQRVAIQRALAAGAYVRGRGEDFAAGQAVLPAGRRLRPQEIGLLAMLGRAQVEVFRQPRLAVLATGDELVAVEQPLAAGMIHDSNSHTLAALAISCGAEVTRLGIAPDDADAIRARLDEAAAGGADLILTSAGVSVGSYDYVRKVLETDGELDFWRVNMRPGKPLAFGRYRGVPLVGLPGNPASTFVGFEVFLRPALHHLSGERGWTRPTLRAALAETVESDGRESYLRAQLRVGEDGRLEALLAGHQGSGNLYGLAQADALIVLPAGVQSLPAGSMVDAWPLL
ncbi:MAG: molybdopterin molybdotransferase MoeA [Chloroflexi bacterium]|nr:molybdopterin molybdotransferase MoeA [Chloroflexota bacterium]